MSNKEYDNIEKWIHKYELNNAHCEQCQQSLELWETDSVNSICFDHKWNNPIYVKRELKELKMVQYFLGGFLVVAGLLLLGLSVHLLIDGISNLHQGSWESLLILILVPVLLALDWFLVWFWRLRIKELAEEIKEMKSFSGDWKKK